MRKLEVRIRQMIWSLKNSFKLTTYDTVIYEGKEFYIKSSLIGYNVWDLYEINTLDVTYRKIKGEKLKLVNSFNRCIKVFKKSMNFQKGYWGLIDEQNPIGIRLTYISSDDISFYNNNDFELN